MAKPLRIVTVYQTDPFQAGQGGGARYVRNLLTEQSLLCEQVMFFGVGDKPVQQGNVYLIPLAKSVGSYIPFLFRLSLKLLRMDLSEYSVVQVHRLYFAIPFMLLKPRLKIVSTQHGRSFAVFGDRFGLLARKVALPILTAIERFALKRIDHFIPVSPDVIQSFTEKHPDLIQRHAGSMTTIGAMLDFSAFEAKRSNYLQTHYGSDFKYIVFVGRLAAVKHIDFLLKMFGEHFQDRPEVKFVLVGAGEDEAKLKSLAANTCPNNAPIFHGAIPGTEVPLLLQSGNLLLVASHHEGGPTIVAEALASGLPVVTNQVGDVDEFIETGQNGFIVEKTTQAYAAAIDHILANEPDPTAVHRASKASLNQRSAEHVGQRYLQVYADLTEQHS